MRAMRHRPTREGGFALLSAIIFLVVILILGGSLIMQSTQELHRASRARRETAAFNLAEAGIDYAAWRLYNNRLEPLPVTWTRSDLGLGSFSVTASVYNASTDTVTLGSTGTYEGWTSEVKVVGRFLSNNGNVQNPVFGHALFSDADLIVSGSFNVTGDSFANGNVLLKGGATVDGDVGAFGTITTQGSPTVTGQTLPGQPRITMPTIDIAYYRSIATTIYESSHSFNGDTTLDGVVFVDGDVSVNANFSGKGLIVATGRITVNGNCTLANGDSEFALVTSKSVRVNGTCQIDGWIYAHNVDVPGAFGGNGNATVTGGVAADVINCNGNLIIHYDEATVELPGATGAPSQLDAVSWRRVK